MKANYSGYLKHCAVGVLIYILVNLLMAGIAAYLISTESIQTSSLAYIVPVIQLVSAIISAIYLCRKEKEKTFVKCLIEAALVLAVIILIGVVSFSAKLNMTMMGVLAIVAGYLGTSIVQNKKKGRGNTPKYKYKNS